MKNAVCDVLIVQTSALDEDWVFAEKQAAVAPDEAGRRPIPTLTGGHRVGDMPTPGALAH
ncbi:MAG: hypothetical protein ABJA93_02910 [Sporichthyaceae bacterium]